MFLSSLPFLIHVILVVEVSFMKENILKWLNEGNITIPQALLSYYKEMNLNEKELVLLLHVFSFIEKGNDFPTPNEICERMTISLPECTEMLRKLIQKGFIKIEDGYSDEGIRFEKYTLEPLWDKLVTCFLFKKREETILKEEEKEESLYTVFEQEFGRPLSPFECETLAMWIDDDGHDPSIIKAALKEAVLSSKLNFRYIDRILFEWKKNGIKTVEQARNHGEKFRQYQTKKHVRQEGTEKNRKTVPFYNWLEQ